MSSLFCIVLAAVFTILEAGASNPIKDEEGVLVLNKDNFDSAIADNPYILVDFYAPWCYYSTALEPEYAMAARTLEENESPIKLAKFDVSAQDLADAYEVTRFPTLRFFRSGVPVAYHGGRKASQIVNWVNNKAPGNELLL